MLKTLKKLFGIEEAPDYRELMEEGAVIVDVRSKGEFNQGHIRQSVNIPLDVLSGNLSKFKDKDQAIITCCASGMRSASAKGILKAKGYSRVYNGGSWLALQRKIS